MASSRLHMPSPPRPGCRLIIRRLTMSPQMRAHGVQTHEDTAGGQSCHSADPPPELRLQTSKESIALWPRAAGVKEVEFLHCHLRLLNAPCRAAAHVEYRYLLSRLCPFYCTSPALLRYLDSTHGIRSESRAQSTDRASALHASAASA